MKTRRLTAVVWAIIAQDGTLVSEIYNCGSARALGGVALADLFSHVTFESARSGTLVSHSLDQQSQQAWIECETWAEIAQPMSEVPLLGLGLLSSSGSVIVRMKTRVSSDNRQISASVVGNFELKIIGQFSISINLQLSMITITWEMAITFETVTTRFDVVPHSPEVLGLLANAFESNYSMDGKNGSNSSKQ